MDTKELILGQTTYEVSQKGKTVQDALSERILQNLAHRDPVDDPHAKRYNEAVGGSLWRRIKNE